MEEINYFYIVILAFVAIASPGPATLAIIGVSMRNGRDFGLSLAAGVLTGSLIWSVFSAFWLATILQNNTFLFKYFQYIGAFYLLYLAFKSFLSALGSKKLEIPENEPKSILSAYLKGLLIHLTNPKAIMFFSALYSTGVPDTTTPMELLSVILSVAAVSSVVFFCYALLFSNNISRTIYLQSKVVFESMFSLLFGAAAVQLLVTTINKVDNN